MAPVGPWDLNYAQDSCRLARAFGNPADPTMLLFESASPGIMSMVAIGAQLKVSAGAKVVARFMPDRMLVDGEGGRSSDWKKPAAIWPTISVVPADLAIAAAQKAKAMQQARRPQRPPPIDLAEVAANRVKIQAFAATITGVEIDAPRLSPIQLQTGSLGRALTMLEQCTRDQFRDWGVDPEVENKIVQPAWPIAVDRWFRGADYPVGAISRDEQSIVKVRLLVDANGRPTKCTTLSYIDAPAFQTIVCRNLMSRARFEPAQLADGSKVASYYSTNIIWRIGS